MRVRVVVSARVYRSLLVNACCRFLFTRTPPRRRLRAIMPLLYSLRAATSSLTATTGAWAAAWAFSVHATPPSVKPGGNRALLARRRKHIAHKIRTQNQMRGHSTQNGWAHCALKRQKPGRVMNAATCSTSNDVLSYFHGTRTRAHRITSGRLPRCTRAARREGGACKQASK